MPLIALYIYILLSFFRTRVVSLVITKIFSFVFFRFQTHGHLKNVRKKPKGVLFVLGYLISTEEAKVMLFVLIMESGSGDFDGSSNLNLNNEIMNNLNNTMIHSMLF